MNERGRLTLPTDVDMVNESWGTACRAFGTVGTFIYI